MSDRIWLRWRRHGDALALTRISKSAWDELDAAIREDERARIPRLNGRARYCELCRRWWQREELDCGTHYHDSALRGARDFFARPQGDGHA